jgi:hypothetical protein
MRLAFALAVPALSAALTLAAVPAAQSGPWTDGELLVRSVGPAPGSQNQTIYRVDPNTGHGEALIDSFYWAGWAGSLVFDPYRDGLLCNMGLPPDSVFLEKLWLVAADGSATVIPGFTDQRLRALTPIGDGRVYFQYDQGDPTWKIHYLDASDNVQTLMDSSGVLPLSFSVEHMLYHAPTNSLLASNSGWWSSNDCVPGESGVFRIPLSPDGSQVAGPIVCSSIVTGISNDIISMDYLPGGDVLLCMAGSQFFHDTLRRLNPNTLTNTLWASPTPADINGAVWSSRIGKAVVLDDATNVLRMYSPGQTGNGLVMATDFPVSPFTTGFSPVETLGEVDLNGPGCIGTSLSLGPGLAGAGGLTPSLSTSGCPDVGVPFSIEIESVRGGASGWLALGFAQGALPILGGTLYVTPVASLVPVSVGGAPAAPGAGALSLPVIFSSPALAGLNLYFQGLFIDPAAAQFVSMTNGLLISIG